MVCSFCYHVFTTNITLNYLISSKFIVYKETRRRSEPDMHLLSVEYNTKVRNPSTGSNR